MEVAEVSRFLARTTPFSGVGATLQTELARAISVYYFRAGEMVKSSEDRLLIVRTGLFARLDSQQQLLEKLQEGDFYGYQAAQPGEQLMCEEDGLVYWLAADAFARARTRLSELDRFFLHLAARTLHQQQRLPDEGYFTLKVGDLVRAHKIVITPAQTVQEAASLMSERRVSSLLVEMEGALQGIITDRDLRSRVVARGLPATTRVGDVMTREPKTIERDAYLFEALQQMGQWRVHHLPVLSQGRVDGMITVTDLVRAQQEHPVYLLTDIHRQPDLDSLVRASAQTLKLARILGRQGVPAHEASHILATVGDGLTQRLIELAQGVLGPAPCDFSWLVFGSFARRDQGLNADQDNGLLLAQPPEGEVGRYFAALARFVCDGLARCGLPYCTGNIMAINPALCLDLTAWLARFKGWIETPTPQALLNASVFFDLRMVAGSAPLFAGLQRQIVADAREQPLFLMHLAQNALERSAPLGLFRHFILERDGQQQKGLDLKVRGISLITDLVRVYALASGIADINTRQRLLRLAQEGGMDTTQSRNLCDAFDLLAQLRWEHHLARQQQIDAQGEGQISNHLDPATLSGLQRHQLKDCFGVINEGQALLKYRFCRGL
ncbi:CBS domain-containing protein [Aeromonas australiensis]|uniref:DUF294 nucleotidyltransferase-like domain-containing protein n=1 Tax=Aeromonas australiensis TaxID=1114880 RepID=UPI001F44DAD5|nr:DUF294 nucleotidyltransferase-like domain-containing protein [Aeromonas australiensis]MCF3097077.1 CBS domain-containing protein [Aeromonas australiensis]